MASMHLPFARPTAALLAGLFVIAACTADESVSTAELPACSSDQGVARDIEGWPLMGSAEAEFLAVVMSSLVCGG